MKKTSFTLIELLVVVAIIAVLIALLLPALTRARDEGKKITCQIQERQIGTAMMMYVNIFPDYFPPFEHPYPSWGGDIFDVLLCRFGGIPSSIFRCPCDNIPRGDWGGVRTYSYNDRIPSNGGIPTGKIPDPAATVAMTEWATGSNILFRYGCGDVNWVVYFEPGLGTIHNGGGNYLWFDGHVSWIYREALSQEWYFYNKDTNE